MFASKSTIHLKVDPVNVTLGELSEKITSTGRVSGYQIEMWHKGLNEHKYLSASDIDVLAHKIQSLADKWDEKWSIIKEKKENKETAERITNNANRTFSEIDKILHRALDVNNAANLDWDSLKDNRKFEVKEFEKQPFIIYSEDKKPLRLKDKLYKEPMEEDIEYQPKLNLFDHIITAWKENKISEKKYDFDSDHKRWRKEQDLRESIFKKELNQWETEEAEFIRKQTEHNQNIDNIKKGYFQKEVPAIIGNCEQVLKNSQYPINFVKNFEIDFNICNGVLIVNYLLPNKDDFPTLKEMKYLVTNNELKESHLTENQLNEMYDTTLYNISLRTIHELFKTDLINVISTIVFNGWVEFINPATGNIEKACILSLSTAKDKFDKINLKNINPKDCFKSLKGVSSSKLYGLTPIKPILQINREDKRFISSIEVAVNTGLIFPTFTGILFPIMLSRR
ncbi:MAG: hypothetical protein GX660_02865 [Clostridiaceae bacterium]|nr:hypothetical protein [Clostridiaceae bacterium]